MRTIYSKVAQRGRCGALDFNVWAVEEKQYRLERGAVHRAYIWTTQSASFSPSNACLPNSTSLSDLGKGQASASLQVDVLAVHERAERVKRLAREEVGLLSLCRRVISILAASIVSSPFSSPSSSRAVLAGRKGIHSRGSSAGRRPLLAPNRQGHCRSLLSSGLGETMRLVAGRDTEVVAGAARRTTTTIEEPAAEARHGAQAS